MSKMILTRFSWLLLALPFQTVFGAEDLPKPFGFDRYQSMSDKSPFAVATTVAAPAETPNFAKDLYIANVAHSPEADLVTVASSTDRVFKKYLTTASLVDGYGISGIEWSDKVGATKVTITKDGQTATLSFNEALLHAPAGGGQPGAPVPPQPAPPGKVAEVKETKDPTAAAAQVGAPPPGATTGAQQPTKAMPVPALPNPNPPAAPAGQVTRTRGVIPRNPNSPNGGPAMMKAAPPQPPQ